MIKIIFVDDEKNLLDGLKRMLRKKKDEWDMVFVMSGQAVLDLLEKNKYHMVVSDYKMPGMDGLELLQMIKEKYPETNRIILSGQSETEVYDKAKEFADAYIPKPCSPEILISVIEKTANP